MPDVSVVIPHYQDLSRLRRCLLALQAQHLDCDRFEVIVADNGTHGGVACVAREFPAVRFVHEPRRGAAHARNTATAAAMGRVLAFTDADCEPESGWLEQGVRALDSADVIGGAVAITWEDESQPSPVELFERLFAFRQAMYIRRKGFAATANLFVRRETFDAVGCFRQGTPEDKEWCRRARAMGYRLGYAPAAVVRHPARATWQALVSKWERSVKESWAISGAAGSRRRRLAWTLRALAVAASPIPHSVRVCVRERSVGFEARRLCLAVLFRIRWFRALRMLRLAQEATRSLPRGSQSATSAGRTSARSAASRPETARASDGG